MPPGNWIFVPLFQEAGPKAGAKSENLPLGKSQNRPRNPGILDTHISVHKLQALHH